MKRRARDYFAELQETICRGLSELEGKHGKRFGEDRWDYEPGAGRTGSGGGVTRMLADAAVFEKAGVNLADVQGSLTERLAERLEVEPQPFYATGLSLVLHPRSPMVPTVHMNLRYIELLGDKRGRRKAWFGGGADLTPYYLFPEDARHFHETLRRACAGHDEDCYGRFKKWCDEYFHLRHRDEARGIGGIFFDYLEEGPEETFALVRDIGGSFLEAYVPIVERRKDLRWYDREREWQLLRRGRYVEFNLVYDRGTLFGLETGGRTESILMSLPPLVRWRYDHHPEPGSREAELLEVLRTPCDWLATP